MSDCEVALEVGEGDAVLVHVDALGAGGEAAQEGEVAAAPAHHLDHEAALRGHGGRLDLVHRATMLLRAVSLPIDEIGAGQVVVDRGGEADHRQVEGREPLPLGVELGDRRVARPAADHQDPVDLMLLDVAGDLVELAVGALAAVRPELGAAPARPAVDAHPAHLEELALDQAPEAVAHAEHVVAAIEGEAQRQRGRRCSCRERAPRHA